MKISGNAVRSFWGRSVATVALTAAMALPASAQNVVKDLQSVIALQGKSCGQVTSASKQGPDHYIAECSNGKRYRVQADANGRVNITPL